MPRLLLWLSIGFVAGMRPLPRVSGWPPGLRPRGLLRREVACLLQPFAGGRLAAVGTVFAQALFQLRDVSFKPGDLGTVPLLLLIEQGHNQPTESLQSALGEGALKDGQQLLLLVSHSPYKATCLAVLKRQTSCLHDDLTFIAQKLAELQRTAAPVEKTVPE